MTRLSVLLTTEGTYPFHKGGVSTWCHVLTQNLPEIDFKILAVVANPYLPQRYELSDNVRGLIKVPLWGTEDPIEFTWRFPFSRAIRSKMATTEETIQHRFLPLLESFLRAVLFASSDIEALGQTLLAMHQYFLHYDYQRTWLSQAVWQAFKGITLGPWQQDYGLDDITLAELTDVLRLLYRLLIPIHQPIPKVDIVHSSAAAFCGLPGVLAKLQNNTPYLLTEHGINIREQYLNLNRSILSGFARLFLYRLMAAVVKLNFYFADQVSPVCEFNARWERWWGVEPERINVVYNGADPKKFRPTSPMEKDHPIVMNMGLIFPLKGQLDLVEAAAIVRDRIPNVEFRFYGRPSDEEYFAECQKRVQQHQLEPNINWAGFTSEPWRAYSEADVVAMSSISEGFPFAVIEAMLSGATIVSTDVGGVREAIADTGLLVRSSRPAEMAEAILRLLEMPAAERSQYGQKALERSRRLFTQQTLLDAHRNIYSALSQPRQRLPLPMPLSLSAAFIPSYAGQ
ncbi:glycosyltransferase [filamentous cyanobacterium CCP5]|nr:glycosyltransferase [filamentous cyanobacterium CCP5]